MPCGFEGDVQPCAASVCLEKMVAHYEEAHGAEIFSGPFNVKILDDGSKVIQTTLLYTFQDNGEGWFAHSRLKSSFFRTAVGGCFALNLQTISASELRFGVRQLGRGPPRHRLASVKVSFGTMEGTFLQYLLSRALAADERLGDAALCAGTLPAVGRVDPTILAPTLVLKPGTPPQEKSWQLFVTSTLVFRMVRDAPP